MVFFGSTEVDTRVAKTYVVEIIFMWGTDIFSTLDAEALQL